MNRFEHIVPIWKTILMVFLFFSTSTLCGQCLIGYDWTFDPTPSSEGWNSDTEVDICLSISSEQWDGGSRYLHAVIPEFGNGWDISSLTQTPPTSCSGDGGFWYWESDNVTSSASGDTFGPGFYYESPLGGSDPNDPGDNFGDHCPINEALEFCWTIRTLTLDDCVDGSGLDISVNTLSDDESGGSALSTICDDDDDALYEADLICCDAQAGVSSTHSICRNDSPFPLDNLIIDGQSGGQWYFQDTASTSLGAAPLFDPDTDIAGTYFYVVEGDFFDCVSLATIEILIDEPFSAGADSSVLICQSGGIVELLPLLGNNADPGGSWSDPDGNPWNGPWLNPFSDISGNYVYYVPANGACPADSSTLEIVITDNLDAGIGGAQNICSCADTTALFDLLMGTPDSGGRWIGPGGQDSDGLILPLSSEEGTYTYILEGVNCYDEASITIQYTQVPDPGQDSTINICPSSDSPLILFDFLGPDAQIGGLWTDPMGEELDFGVLNEGDVIEGQFQYSFSCADCSVSSSVNIILTADPVASILGDVIQCDTTPVPIALDSPLSDEFMLSLSSALASDTIFSILGSGESIAWSGSASDSVFIAAISYPSLPLCPVQAVDDDVLIVVGPPPSASISDDIELCEGQTVILTPMLDGNGPFSITVESSATNVQSSFNNIPQGGQIELFPTTGTTYSLIEVSDASSLTCTSPGSGDVAISFLDPPTVVSIMAESIICPGDSAEIDVDIIGDFSAYSLVFDTGFDSLEVDLLSPSGIVSIPVPFSTPPDLPYCLIDLSPLGTNACPSVLQDTCLHFTVLQPLLTFGVQVNCIEETQEGVVSFSIQGGAPPYTVDGQSIVGNSFSGESLPNGAPFSYEVSDSRNCGPVLRQGVLTCECLDAAAGDLIATQDTLELCIGETANLIYNASSELLDPTDVRSFVLHDGASNVIGTIWQNLIDINEGIEWQEGMSPGVVYWVHALVGNALNDGLVDADDVCLELSNGIPIRFFAPPMASFDAPAALCAGEPATLTINLDGQGPWNFELWQDGDFFQSFVMTGFQVQLSTTETGTYTVEGLQDSRCVASSVAQVAVSSQALPTAMIGDGGLYCAGSGQGPQLSLEGTGPWTLAYTIDGEENSVTLSSANDLLPATLSGTYMLQEVSDIFCTGPATGSAEVDVLAEPTLDIDLGDIACPGDSVRLYIAASGAEPFELGWTLTEENITLSGDTTLYFTQASELDFLSFSDSQCPSFDLGPALQIEFYPEPSALATVQPEQVCEGEPATLNINTEGFGAEQSIQWLFQGDTIDSFTEAGVILFSWTPDSDESILLLDVRDTTSGCRSTLDIELILDHVLFPVLELGPSQDICDGDTLFLGISLEDDVTYSASESIAFLPGTEDLYWSPTQIGTSTLYMTAQRETCLTSDSLQVSSEIVAAPFFTLQPEIIRAADPIFYASNTGAGLVDLWWTLDGDTIGQGPGLNYQLPRDIAEDYELCLDARRPLAGCPGRYCRTIRVQGELDIYIPNAFSPDGDGINDVFEVSVLNTDPSFFTLEIFDRSGSVVFLSERLSQGWDGRDQDSGRELPTGVYSYRLITRDRFGRDARTRTGFVTLLR